MPANIPYVALSDATSCDAASPGSSPTYRVPAGTASVSRIIGGTAMIPPSSTGVAPTEASSRRQTTTSRAAATASAALPATRAPRAAGGAALAGSRLQTVSGCPAVSQAKGARLPSARAGAGRHRPPRGVRRGAAARRVLADPAGRLAQRGAGPAGAWGREHVLGPGPAAHGSGG
ncbi:hypothetical protein SCATT_p08850 (plasmid) [Streptantibioticus cattleyicolor NRRL 8057 = DSM 46488]|uniref:Uncharacterized protein n=1 Tax=Streptantibioticus cattleyicolor (strain ATCC 35852 / DSM 46488 / JCM 4925 / NBRC 14057 / NRRL 8057) TaxID=1003195 RepID=G8XDD2_STREN|nr:hypothetical protein SCATT_p08850 [Streptantibioticus cattleyicolor NRRL 8057 = DSM 46488]